MAEIAELTPHFAGVTYERLVPRGLQWPVAADGTDSPISSSGASRSRAAAAHLAALPYQAPGNEASEEFPLILVTGRRLEHYNVGTMTRRTGNLALLTRETARAQPRRRRAASRSPTATSSTSAARSAQTRIARRTSPTGSSRATPSRRSTSPRRA